MPAETRAVRAILDDTDEQTFVQRQNERHATVETDDFWFTERRGRVSVKDQTGRIDRQYRVENHPQTIRALENRGADRFRPGDDNIGTTISRPKARNRLTHRPRSRMGIGPTSAARRGIGRGRIFEFCRNRFGLDVASDRNVFFRRFLLRFGPRGFGTNIFRLKRRRAPRCCPAHIPV